MEPTNNACERALRPGVIQRKVTNGYRAMWAADFEAGADRRRTARLAGAGPFKTILEIVAPLTPGERGQAAAPEKSLRGIRPWVVTSA